jgi:putative hydrolase of HD superfamily
MREYLEFTTQVGELKELKRSGWKRHGIEPRESVADHTARSVILAMTLPKEIEVNRARVAQMLAIHDLPETDPAVGDITPFDGVSDDEKFEREKAAMSRLCSKFSNGDEIYQLWLEYEAQETPESRVAHDLDKLEMAMQAVEYERKHDLDLWEFIESATAKISHPVLQNVLKELIARRGERG